MIKNIKYLCLLSIACIAMANTVHAQNIFQKRSGLDYWYTQFTSVFPSDTGFFTLGAAIGLIPTDTGNLIGPRRLLMTWYDWQGNIVKEKYHVRNKTDYYGMWYDNNPINNTGFYHFGSFKDSLTISQSNTSDLFIARFNYEGDTIWTRRYNSNYFDVGAGCITANNGDLIGVGYSNLANGTMVSRIMRFDSLGNIRWNKTYNNGFENYTRHIVKDNEGNFYVGGWRRPIGGSGSNPMNARTMVFKIDSAGIVQWTKYLPAICDEYGGGFSVANDGNILVASFRCYNEVIPEAIDGKLSLWKLNKDTGDTLWCKVFPSQLDESTNESLFIEQLTNGDIILGGIGLKLFIENEDTLFGKRAGVFIKTDSTGLIKWQHYYFYNAEHADSMVQNYITDGKQASDGGFILVGKTQHSTDYNDCWIIKTNENGCIDAGCVNGIEELEDDDFRLFIYPNPTDNYVTVKLPITHSNAKLQFIDMQGRIVKTIALSGNGSQTIETTDLPGGIYQLVVSSKNKVLGREKLVVVK